MKRTATTKRTRRKDPRIGGPGPCAICHIFRGGRTLTLSRFFRAGPVPSWAIVHKGCDRRESFYQFRERFARWEEDERWAVALRGSHGDARSGVDAINEPSRA